MISRCYSGVIEIVVGKADFISHAAARADELGTDDANQRIGDREFGAGQNIGAADGGMIFAAVSTGPM